MFENEEIVQKIKEEKTLREIAEDLNISLNDVNQRIMQVKNKGLIAKYASKRLRQDKEIAEIAIQQDSRAKSYFYL